MAQDRVIRIRVDSRQAQRQLAQLNNQVNGTNRSLSTAGSSASRFSGIIGRAGLAASVGLASAALVKVAENFQRFEARLKLATSSVEEFERVSQSLLESSLETGTSLAENADLYTKIANATKETSLSSSQLVGITNTLNKAFLVSGTTSEEAANALRQLSQGLASGVLRGDEFNSVAEQAPILLDSFAASIGITRGELRAFAADGKLTTEVVLKALEDSATDIDDKFSTLPVTFSQAGQSLSNAFGLAVDGLNKGLGDVLNQLGLIGENETFTSALAKGAKFYADEIANAVDGVDTLEEKTQRIAKLADTLVEEEKILNKLKEGGLFISDSDVEAQQRKVDEQREYIEALVRERDTAEDLLAIQERAEKSQKERASSQAAVQRLLEKLGKAQKTVLEEQSKLIEQINSGEDSRITKIKEQTQKQIDALDEQLKKDTALLKTEEDRSKVNTAILEQKQLIKDTAQVEIDAVNQVIEKEKERARIAAEEAEKRKVVANARNIADRESGVVSSRSDVDRGLAGLPGAEQETEFDRLQRQGEEVLELRRVQAENERALAAEQRKQNILNEEEYQQRLTEITQNAENDRLSIKQAVTKAEEALTFDSFKDTLGALSTFSKKAFKINQAVGIAETAISIARGIAKAQELGFPANLAESARVAAVGVAQIRAIKSQNPSGGGGVSPSAGSAGGGSAPQTALSQQQAATSPTREVFQSRTSRNDDIVRTLNNIDADFIPTSVARRIAERLAEVRDESGVPTGGFEE